MWREDEEKEREMETVKIIKIKERRKQNGVKQELKKRMGGEIKPYNNKRNKKKKTFPK